jgi:hypothetical protein
MLRLEAGTCKERDLIKGGAHVQSVSQAWSRIDGSNAFERVRKAARAEKKKRVKCAFAPCDRGAAARSVLEFEEIMRQRESTMVQLALRPHGRGDIIIVRYVDDIWLASSIISTRNSS